MIGGEYITRKNLKPGQPGTEKYVRQFGDELVCIRHRYSKSDKKKIVTAEIVIEKKEWSPDYRRIPHNKIMDLRVAYEEKRIREMIKQVGGRWNPNRKVWQLPFCQIVSLGLQNRIVNVKRIET